MAIIKSPTTKQEESKNSTENPSKPYNNSNHGSDKEDDKPRPFRAGYVFIGFS